MESLLPSLSLAMLGLGLALAGLVHVMIFWGPEVRYRPALEEARVRRVMVAVPYQAIPVPPPPPPARPVSREEAPAPAAAPAPRSEASPAPQPLPARKASATSRGG